MKYLINTLLFLVGFAIGFYCGAARWAELTEGYCQHYGYFYIVTDKYLCDPKQ